jgi:hypothetical protein
MNLRSGFRLNMSYASRLTCSMFNEETRSDEIHMFSNKRYNLIQIKPLNPYPANVENMVSS